MALTFVKNEEKYWEFIRTLRNLDGVKQGFIQQEHIEKEHHISYMKQFSTHFYICLYNDEPAGYIGVIDDDIRVATHPNYQNKKIGQFMVNNIIKIYPNSYAKIKIDNYSSLKLFEKCGFTKKYYILEINKDS